MSLSRREFLETGALSGTALAFGGLLKPFAAAQAQQPSASSSSEAGNWPISPDIRVVQSFDRDWHFTRIDDAARKFSSTALDISPLNDAGWEMVNLPHSARLEPLNASGGRNYQGLCWYQKRFAAPAEWRGRTLHLVFEGAMSVADVWLNGKHLTTHYGGYIPFVIDTSRHVAFGGEPNVLTVLLNNEDNPLVPPGKPQDQLDFVYFGGLYRSVRIEVLSDLHITDPILADKTAGGGIFVTYPEVSVAQAVVHIQTDVANVSSSSRNAVVRHELRAPDGTIAAKAEQAMELVAVSSKTWTMTLNVPQPALWSPYHPNLYILHTAIVDEGKIVDDQYTRIGIRKFHIDREQGLFINGEKFFSQGANRHQDHPYVGYALPASAHYRDAIKLRDAGFTSYRCHYPQHPAFMDACDELGILGIVSNPGWQFVIDSEVFRDRVYQDAREMIRRDRNHACVLLWEAQLNETNNELVAAELYRIAHEEYPGPDCYTAGDRVMKAIEGFPGWDVEYSRNDGSKPLWVREWGDQVDNWSDQQGSVRVAREWGETPMLVQSARHLQALEEIYAKLDAPLEAHTARAAGADLWAGIDYYRGYHHQPFYGSPLDLFRLPKFDYYLFQSQRPIDANTSKYGSGPMVFIANFATFQSPTTVIVFSNCEEVRLTQNGKIVATQKPDPGYHIPHPPFTFRLEQFSQLHSMLFATGVAKPGTPIGSVKAEGLVSGTVVAAHELTAPGVPSQIRLVLDDCGRPLTADGSDWIRIYAHVCDARGTIYPYSEDEITFEVNGEASLIADAEILANPVRAQAGIATALIRCTNRVGEIHVRASAFGLKSSDYSFASRI
jgi:beta-galactosidase